jgi:hypothetical protein
MKKTIILIVFGCGMAFLSQSCESSCACENPETGKITDIDIQPSESCSDYSGPVYGNCS